MNVPLWTAVRNKDVKRARVHPPSHPPVRPLCFTGHVSPSAREPPSPSHGGVFRFSRLFEYLGPRVLASAVKPFTPSRCVMLVVPVSPPATAPTLPLLPGAIHTDLLVFDTHDTCLIRLFLYCAQDFFKRPTFFKYEPFGSLKKVFKGIFLCVLGKNTEKERSHKI